MSDFPFKETKLKEKLFLREFNHNVDSDELIWHQDREDRIIKIVEASGWLLQLDNKVPVFLENNKTYKIPKYTWHRVIKGKGNLKILLKKL